MNLHPSNQNKRKLLFLQLGCISLIIALVIAGYNFWTEHEAERLSLNATKEVQFHMRDPDSLLLPEYMLNPNMDMPSVEVDGHQYIGILSIPALGLEISIQQAWSYPNLKISPCVYSGTAYLKNMIIAGHSYRSHFGTLFTLPVGSLVKFVDMDGNEFLYNVSKVERIGKNDFEALEGGEWDLSLFTCTYRSQGRLVVRCDLYNKELETIYQP